MAEYIKTLLRNWFSWDVGQETPKPKEEDNKDGAQVQNEVAQQQVQTEETQQVQTEETQQETQQVQIEETQQVQIEDSKQALIEEAQGAQNEEIKIENDPVPVPVRRSESQQINLVDANIAKYGSKKVKAVRHSAALTANDLEGAGAQVGLEIWRVENTAEKFVRRWPTNLFGQFFSSDSYLVLNTYKVADSDTLHHDLHFWIGKESPQAELGVAAYKTAELDDLLREIPILHRELQGHESNLFRSYFTKIGLMILKGAYTTGFSQMKHEEFGSYKRLFMIKREIKGWKVKTGVTFEIPCLATNMNHGDVFALDLGSRVYLWIGKQASTFEKFEGNIIANNIVNSRNGRARRVPIDDLFWEALEGTESDVRSEENPYEVDMSGEDWLDQENVKLFRISEVSGIPKFTLEAKRKVSIKALDSNDVFLIHANVGVWIWEGSNATKQEKEKAFLLADNYMTEYNLPSHLPVTKITEDQAKYSPLFHSLFVDAK